MFEDVKNTHSSCFIKVKNSSAVRILSSASKTLSSTSLTICYTRGCTVILYETTLEQDAWCPCWLRWEGYPSLPQRGSCWLFQSKKGIIKNRRLETSLLLFPLRIVPRALSFFPVHFPWHKEASVEERGGRVYPSRAGWHSAGCLPREEWGRL